MQKYNLHLSSDSGEFINFEVNANDEQVVETLGYAITANMKGAWIVVAVLQEHV